MRESKVPPGTVKTVLLLFLVLFVVCLTYSNHFHNSFHFDDSHTIVNNGYIRDLHNIPKFFKDGTTFSSLPPNQSYRPLVSTTLAIDYALSGRLEPFWFHVSTFIGFLLQGLLMFFLFQKIFGLSHPSEKNELASIFAIAWYLLHPANAETINYIISRSDTLSTLFLVLGLTLYTCSSFSRKYFIYLLPIVIGALAKPPAVMFAPILFVYILFFEEDSGFSEPGKKFWPAFKKTTPALIVCAALYFFIRKMEPATWSPGGTSPYAYLITQPYVTLRYFTTFFLPADLSADTDWVTFTGIGNIRCLLGFGFIAVLLVSIVLLSREREFRPVAFGLSWFLLALLPSSVVPLAEVMNDHRIFFPYVGLVMSVTWSAVLLIRGIRIHIPLFKPLLIALSLVVLGASAYITRKRNEVWKTEESLWKDVTIKSPGNGRGQMNYGLILMGQGDYTGAEIYFERGLERWPYYSYLHINMGILKEATGRIGEAETNFKNGIAYSRDATTGKPTNPEGFFYYARFLKNQKRFPEALLCLNNLFTLSNAHLNGHYLLMEILLETEDFPGLKTAALQTLAISSTDETARYYLKAAGESRSKLDKLTLEVNAHPSPEAYLNQSLAYFNAGQFDLCIQAAKEALKLKSDFAEAWNNMGAANGQLNKWDEEILDCEKALQLKPGFELARNNLAFAKTMKKEGKK
jgi:tetratricopeptide (TPR) repeat protein